MVHWGHFTGLHRHFRLLRYLEHFDLKLNTNDKLK